MPVVILRELRQLEEDEHGNPNRMYKGRNKALQGCEYTGRQRRTEYRGNADKPAPLSLQHVAEQAGFQIYTTEIR